MTFATSIALPLVLLAQGYTLGISQKEGETAKIKTETIESISFNDESDSQSTDSKYGLTLKFKSGEPVSYLLADKPVISFDGDMCIIECHDFKNIFEMKDIDFGSFGSLVSVESAIVENLTLDLSIPMEAAVRGLQAGDSATLYSVDGRVLGSAVADKDGVATLDLSDVSKGTVCIISVNNLKNFKLIKK